MSFAASATGLAVLVLLARALAHGFNLRRLVAPALTALVALAGFLVVILAGWDRADLNFISIDGRIFREQVLFLAGLGSAAVLGGILALTAVVVPLLLLRPTRMPLLALIVPPVLVALLTGAGLVATGIATPEPDLGKDPVDTVDASGEAGATVIVDGLAMPTGLATGPDGEIYFSGLVSPEIIVLQPGGEMSTVATIALDPGARVFHLALHPGWPEEPTLFVSHETVTAGHRASRLVRVTLQPGGAPLIETLVDDLPAAGDHPASALAFCDGYLYLTTGDNDFADPFDQGDNRYRVQIPAAIEGKILRYRLDGVDLVPAGLLNENPPVFAMGFRNPYGITCDPATGLPLVAENGFDGRDQVRLVPPRSNHEWPFSDRRDQLTPPLYDSGLRSIAPTAIAVREHGGRTEIFFTAWHSNALYRLTVEPGGAVSPLNLLHRTRSGALAVTFDQGGCLLVADVTSITHIVIEGCVPPSP